MTAGVLFIAAGLVLAAGYVIGRAIGFGRGYHAGQMDATEREITDLMGTFTWRHLQGQRRVAREGRQ